MKFPITRTEAARKLGRPYTTIVTWTPNRRISEAQFEDLKIRSGDAKRKTIKKKGTKKPRKVKKKTGNSTFYFIPDGGGAIAVDKAELYRLVGEGLVTEEDAVYEVSRQLKVKHTVTLEKV